MSIVLEIMIMQCDDRALHVLSAGSVTYAGI
jgi:hypothetical protein